MMSRVGSGDMAEDDEARELLHTDEQMTLLRGRLDIDEWEVLYLWACGYRQCDIGSMYHVTQQAISKRLGTIRRHARKVLILDAAG